MNTEKAKPYFIMLGKLIYCYAIAYILCPLYYFIITFGTAALIFMGCDTKKGCYVLLLSYCIAHFIIGSLLYFFYNKGKKGFACLTFFILSPIIFTLTLVAMLN
ncbi:MAG: hypothetical protein K0R98_2054 [Rickettsiaceae bacterium]|jgi:hypothetical protein|nr:hypothetical protein [Rickettsiaceae bacterium]